MVTCPHCKDMTRQVKAGHTRSGNQRFICQLCQRRYTPAPRPRGYDDITKAEAIKLYSEGNGIRLIGRMLGVNHQSITNWIRASQAGSERND